MSEPEELYERQMKQPINIVCIKWGTLFGPEYVNNLSRGVRRHATRPVRVFCVTDNADDLDSDVTPVELRKMPFEDAMLEAQQGAPKKGGALRKIAMFEPGLLGEVAGPVLALDLDLVVTGDLAPLADFAPGKLAMPPQFRPHKRFGALGEGSVIKFEPAVHKFLWEDMASDPPRYVRECSGSEQSYTSLRADAHGVFENLPAEWVVSFKVHCRPRRPLNLFYPPRLPRNAKVVCFHGRPNVHEAVNGFRSNLAHTTKPAGWLSKNWH